MAFTEEEFKERIYNIIRRPKQKAGITGSPIQRLRQAMIRKPKIPRIPKQRI